LNIWSAGWHAFAHAPLLGTGAGSFVSAAGLSPIDTAHNTVLTLLVSGGLCALFLAVGILALAARSTLQTRGPLQVALVTALLVWAVTAMVSTVEESRTTWLLMALIALAGRLALEEPKGLAECFPDSAQSSELGVTSQQIA
jgi:O-antigen ligase